MTARGGRRLVIALWTLAGLWTASGGVGSADSKNHRSVETVTRIHIREHIDQGRQAEREGNDPLAAGHYERALQNFMHPDQGVLVMGRRGRPADYDEAARLLARVGKRLAEHALEKDRILLIKEEDRIGNVHRRHEEGTPRDISWRPDGCALLYHLHANRYQDYHDLALSYGRSLHEGPIKDSVRYWSRAKRFRALFKQTRGALKQLEVLRGWPEEKTYVTPQEQAGLDLLPRTQRALGEELAGQIGNWLAREEDAFQAYEAAGGATRGAIPTSRMELSAHIEGGGARKDSVESLENAEELLGVLRFYHDEAGYSEEQVEAFRQRILARALARGDTLMDLGQAQDAKDYYRLAGAKEKYREAKEFAREKRRALRDSMRESVEALKDFQPEEEVPDNEKTEEEARAFQEEADRMADELGL